MYVRRIFKSDCNGKSDCNVGLLTWQLSSPAAYTVGWVLQTMVSFTPDAAASPSLTLALPLTAVHAVWHADEVEHTLQPVPVHPLEQEQSEAVRLGKPPDVADARVRLEPSKMVPPQAGTEQFEPPNPGGHRQLEEDEAVPKFVHDWPATWLANSMVETSAYNILDNRDVCASIVCSVVHETRPVGEKTRKERTS